MKEVVGAQAALREYSATQKRLCTSLFDKYSHAEQQFLTHIPSLGLLLIDGEVWEFKKHGAGVLFKQLSSGAVFDAHQYMYRCPACFDTWRLAQYFESRKIHALNIGSSMFDAQDEAALTIMLAELGRLGKVAPCGDINTFTLLA